MLQYTQTPSSPEIYQLIRQTHLERRHETYARTVADMLANKKLTANGVASMISYAILKTQLEQAEFIMDDVFAVAIQWVRTILWEDAEMQEEAAEYMRNAQSVAEFIATLEQERKDLSSRFGWTGTKGKLSTLVHDALKRHLDDFKQAAQMAAIEVETTLEDANLSKNLEI